MIRQPSEANFENRRILLQQYTQDETILEELLVYCENHFSITEPTNKGITPLENEWHIKDWESYQQEAKREPLIEVLKKKLVTLNFPIKAGISQTKDYRNATLKGRSTMVMPSATGLVLERPKGLTLDFKKGIAGTIPVLIVESSNDFKTLLRALIYKNEPVPIPDSMGASIIKGINNWHRLQSAIMRQQKQTPNQSLKKSQLKVIQDKRLYQDTFVVVSKKPYSNIYPANFTKLAWLKASLPLRIQHEYAHYLTHRFFDSMRNNMHDELLADYLGIHAIKDYFDADLFLQFIGLESYPIYRKGGRMENYRGTPPLSGKAFKVLATILYQAAKSIEKQEQKIGKPLTSIEILHHFFALTQFDLVELANETC